MAKHIFGRRIDGKLGRFVGEYDDEKFQELTKDGLPAGWVAWHFEEGETYDNSKRARAVAKVPVIVDFFGYWADAEQELKIERMIQGVR